MIFAITGKIKIAAVYLIFFSRYFTSSIMKAYISISYNKRKSLSEALNSITATLAEFNIESFVFVDHHKFAAAEEKAMMQQCVKEIDSCDMLVAETSDKAIGIGIEVGYAKAKNKPVIYIRHKDAEHSTTVSGISDFQIIYTNSSNINQPLAATIINVLKITGKN